jgi:peroxiredoxin
MEPGMTASASHDPNILPPGLPGPEDDGAADHLSGMVMPPLALPATSGEPFHVEEVPEGSERLIIYAYPLTGRPGLDPLEGWDQIPGARGCTPESCGFRDHAAELAAAGAAVAGLSAQDTGYQQEAVQRLRLPFPLLSDADGKLVAALRLPAFTPAGHSPLRQLTRIGTLLKRLTLVVRRGPDGRGVVEHVFYPVFPPDGHADEVLGWLLSHPAG